MHGKTKTRGVARELKREGSKRRNIAELLGYEDSGGEMVRKTRIRARARVRSNFLRAVFGVIFSQKLFFAFVFSRNSKFENCRVIGAGRSLSTRCGGIS